MTDMDGERDDYKDNLEQLKDFLEAQKNDMDELKSQVCGLLLSLLGIIILDDIYFVIILIRHLTQAP